MELIEYEKDFKAFQALYQELEARYNRVPDIIKDSDMGFNYMNTRNTINSFISNFKEAELVRIPHSLMSFILDDLCYMNDQVNELEGCLKEDHSLLRV